VARGQLSIKNLYSLSLHLSSQAHAFIVHKVPDIATWHWCLGHVNYRAVVDMITQGLIKGVSPTPQAPIPKCDSYILGKQTWASVPKIRAQGEGGKATQRLEKVWVDLSGPHDDMSRTGGQYVMDIVDDHTSFVWSLILKIKVMLFQHSTLGKGTGKWDRSQSWYIPDWQWGASWKSNERMARF
jgi:hypothetical protein